MGFFFTDDYPVARAVFVSGHRRATLNCIIDTGSPHTIVPEDIVENLGVTPDDIVTHIEIRGIINKEECSRVVPGFRLSLLCAGLRPTKVLAFAYQMGDSHGLIGHNVLRKYRLVVDWRERDIRFE